MKDGEKPRTPLRAAQKRFVSVPVLLSEVACPACGCGEEVWAGDTEVVCTWCGYRIVRTTKRSH